jgi:PadR family transcriptional regulator, regulatory protein AphA
MSLKHALLGFLNYGPMTGYELKKFFDVSVAHFWNAELSQIYPTLKQMESEGLVDMDVDVQHDRPNRKVYTITDDGRRELVDWLAEPAEREQVREPVLIKMFFGGTAAKEELIDVLSRRIEDQREYIRYLEGCEMFIAKFAGAMGMEDQAPFWELTTKLGRKVCEAEAEWAKEAMEAIEKLEPSHFRHEYSGRHDETMHVKEAMEVLDRVSAVLPVAASSKQQAKEESNGTHQKAR